VVSQRANVLFATERSQFILHIDSSAQSAQNTKAVLQLLPMYYLLKTEPTVYSFEQLKHDRETIWDGVTNAAAVKHLREMHKGDKLVIYHTGDERRAVGTAQVLSVDASDPKIPLVKIKAGEAIENPAVLSDIKQNALFADSPLLRQGRLSVVPLTEAQFQALLSGEL